ncbi:MAG TPA: cytochrome c biogenesis protein CcdA, partial [Victivallales bacterium]|nr:cytochrome c biogenesis protein CcdA [Victivallales bacterium]
MKFLLKTIFFCIANFIIFFFFSASALESNVENSFIWKAEKISDSQISVSVQVAENKYLYADSIKISVESSDNIKLPLYFSPKPEKYIDDLKEESIVFKTGSHQWLFSLKGSPPYTVRIRYQGCSKKPFLCYPPSEDEIILEKNIFQNTFNSALKKTKEITFPNPSKIKTEKIYSSNPLIDKFLARGSWWIFLAAFIGGILSTLTPCVLPLIPITIAILSGNEKKTGNAQGFLKTSFYVVGIILMFTALASIAAFSGKAFGSQILGNKIAITIFSGIFFFLSLSMLGLYELQLPSSIQTRFNKIGGSGVIGAFLMGLTAGLIAIPCTGPVLGTLLAIATASGKVFFSITLLFSYACGFGVPFLIISSGIKILPSSKGTFMEIVKSSLGIAIMAMAIYGFTIAFPQLKDFFSKNNNLAKISSLILIIVGFIMGAVHSDGHHSSVIVRFAKIVGALLISIGIIWNLLINPLSEKKLSWLNYSNSIYSEAAKNAKFILL